MDYGRKGIRIDEIYLPYIQRFCVWCVVVNTRADSPKAETKQHQRLEVTSSCQLSAANPGLEKEFLIYSSPIIECHVFGV
jgi:hypothetical protein